MSAAVFTVIAGFGASALADEDKEKAISLDKVPDAVHKALAAYAQDSEVKKVEKGEDDDQEKRGQASQYNPTQVVQSLRHVL